jgi:hypothetical protein
LAVEKLAEEIRDAQKYNRIKSPALDDRQLWSETR